MSAYQAFMAEDDATAGRLYRQAMQSEPRNVDVLLGLAAIAVRQDQPGEAEQYYMRVLELEPRNAVAQAGLIGLMGQADPVNSESRLKNLLTQQPDSGFLHQSLGNLYAEQGQWPSAQQSYFQAFHLEPARAEYAYNLAISLDHLNKPDIALNYYQRALELLPTQQGSLDKGQLETRISQLRQQINK
jgi:tetratricopeptide (TPR) repeat protein